MFMVREVVAYCPGHISGYFKRMQGKDAATTGSIGAGIVIREGVIARVEKSDTVSVHIHRKDRSGKKTVVANDSPPLTYAMNLLSLTATVTTECTLPIGAGFGLSAAALLATLTALDTLYDLGMGEERIARAAHEAEITHRTGLGDVAACRGGGFVVRPFAGITAPVRRYCELSGPLHAASFGPIHTPSVLGSEEQMDRVASAFPAKEPQDIEEFFLLSRTFAERSGLVTPRVQEALNWCDEAGVLASMTMLGEGVFAYGEGGREALARAGGPYELHIAHQGPGILEAAV